MNLRTAAFLLVLPACAADDHQYEQDQMLIYGVLDTEVFLYGQQLVGLPVGAQDVTAACPLGGSVHIFGTTMDDGVANVALTFSLADCSNAGSGYDLTLTGDLAFEGSFSSDGYKALSTTSAELAAQGTVQAGAESAQLDERCALAVTDRGEAGQVSVVSGEWCGRYVSF